MMRAAATHSGSRSTDRPLETSWARRTLGKEKIKGHRERGGERSLIHAEQQAAQHTDRNRSLIPGNMWAARAPNQSRAGAG